MQNYAYSDFHPKLNLTSSQNVKILYDEEVITQSIRTILATVQGERVRSNFGSGLVRYLFEPISRETAEDIRAGLIQAISENEPRVDVNRVIVTPDIDNYTYDVQIELFISALSQRTIFEAKLRSFAG
jgi:hypothetical protein